MQDLSGAKEAISESRIIGEPARQGYRVQANTGGSGLDVLVTDAGMARFLAHLFERAAVHLSAAPAPSYVSGTMRPCAPAVPKRR